MNKKDMSKDGQDGNDAKGSFMTMHGPAAALEASASITD